MYRKPVLVTGKIKKILLDVDKSQIKKICVDDFALKKRYTYGTVMINIENHKIIDMIPSREMSDVVEWLRTFPNIELVSRDRSQTYASAIKAAHPNAIQFRDRFHILTHFSEPL